MKSVGPVISPLGSASPAETVCSGVSRRANASAVARSHWSPIALTASSRSRSASTGTRPRAGGAPVLELEPQPAGVLELVPPGRQVEHGDAVQAVGRYDVVARRQRRAVDDEQDVGRRRALVGAEPRPVAEVGRQQRGEVVERGRHHPLRADRVGLAGRSACGAATSASPSGPGSRSVASTATTRCSGAWNAADEQIIARARDRAGSSVAAHLDPVERAQVDAGRQVGLHPVHDEQPVQRRRGGRVDLVDRGALRRHQLERQRLRAEPVPHVQEVVVAAGVLPDPGPLLGEGRQRGRLGVVPGQRATLLVGGVAGDRRMLAR